MFHHDSGSKKLLLLFQNISRFMYLIALIFKDKIQIMKFIVDEMYGKIIKWLRMLGYDTISTNDLIITKSNAIREEKLVEKVFNENRIAISRDWELLEKIERRFYETLEKNPEIYAAFQFNIPMAYGLSSPCYHPTSNDVPQILAEMKILFNIRLDYSTNNSRCAKCNSNLQKILQKDKIRKQIPEKVYRFQKSFWQCKNPTCGQIYWNGTQIKSNKQVLSQIKLKLNEVSFYE